MDIEADSEESNGYLDGLVADGRQRLVKREVEHGVASVDTSEELFEEVVARFRVKSRVQFGEFAHRLSGAPPWSNGGLSEDSSERRRFLSHNDWGAKK